MAPATFRGQEIIVPAGTIVQCTLTESNLSSKTAERGDPVRCDAGPLYEFGVPVPELTFEELQDLSATRQIVESAYSGPSGPVIPLEVGR
jgi:hypothetical protein